MTSIRKKIMVVDGDDANRQLIFDCLAGVYDILEADSCGAATKALMAQSRLIELVLCDIKTLREDKYRLLALLKTNEFRQIPMFCTCGSEYDEATVKLAEREALGYGAVDFITLVSDAEVIRNRVRNQLNLIEGVYFARSTLKADSLSGYDKTEENGTFWNPNSLDALIMRTYVGAACILDSMDDYLAILRSNDRFSLELLGRVAPTEALLTAKLNNYLDEKNRDKLKQAMLTCSSEGAETTCELLIHDLRPDQPIMHIRLAMKLIDRVKSRCLFYCTLENDTEQYEARRSERAMAEQLQIIMQNFSGGVTAAYETGEKIEYLYANDGFYSLFGYNSKSFYTELSTGIFELITPEYLDKVKEALRESEKMRKRVALEYQVKKRDGSLIWVRSRNTVCHVNEIDRPVYITVYEDITVEKRAEKRIQAINERLANSDVFIHLDVTNRKVEEFRSKYGSDGIDFSEGSFQEYFISGVYEEDKDAVRQGISYESLLNRYAMGETKYSIEYRLQMPENAIIWFRTSVILTEGISNNSVNAFIYCQNIDKEMKRRIAINKLVETSVDDITLINIDSGIVRILQLHEGAVAKLGESYFAENTKRYIEYEVAEEDKIRCRQMFTIDNIIARLDENSEFEFSYWIITKDKSNRRINAYFTYLDSTHKDVLMTGSDITELFEKEQEHQMALQHAADLANYANKAKSDFLSRMSHDMRTPLNAIIGVTELAAVENKEPKISGYLKNIDSSSQYLLGLINDTLDLSKIESGKMELKEESLPFSEFIDGINTVIKPLMDAKRITFTVSLKQKPQSIVVDKMRFTQVFYNLLSNAAKYTPEGGSVEFTSESIKAKNGKLGIRFYVKDNGIGMSKEYLKILFEPFTQENREQRSEQKGTGLGLAIVKQIVDLTGGSVSVTSEINKGTEFVVDIYAHSVIEAKYDSTELKYDPEKLVGRRVLVVDDVEVNTMILQKLLEYRGCFVETASNGKEAVEMFKSSDIGYYDLIMTDVRMSVMDGLEEARRIRSMKRSDAKSVPIIAITADAYSEVQDITQEAGMNARLVKPIKTEIMCETIVKLLDEAKA